MKAEDVAHHVAAKLPGDFGHALQYEVEHALNNPPPQPQATRSMVGEALSRSAEIAVIAHFIVSIAPVVLAKINVRRDPEAAKTELKTAVTRPPGLKAETAAQVIDLAVEKAAERD